MYSKKQLETLLSILTEGGVDFAEFYIEEGKENYFILQDSKLDDMMTRHKKGVGIRIIHNNETTYASLSSPSYSQLEDACKKLASSFAGPNKRKVFLKEEKIDSILPVKISFDAYKIEEKISLLKKIDQIARNYSPLIYQVVARLMEDSKEFTVVNSNGLFVHDYSIHLRLFEKVSVMQEDKIVSYYDRFGKSMGYEMLDLIDLKKFTEEICQKAIDKLDVIHIKGGRMPVVIKKGWGAVLIHEACGHGLEATAIAPGFSVFCDKLGTQVASSKVTLIDDATIPNEWGSYTVDDEGRKSEKHILIEKGILKDYLVDFSNQEKMNHPGNGCGRREDYQYAPTSRMSNTYIANGEDSIEKMIQSIDYGIYATNLNGGSVDTNTGDFNFAVDIAYLIEQGKITKRIAPISLIGNSLELLSNIEMIADDLELSDGYCGSESGMIHVTVGQPTLKVSSILVGGMESE